jgi:hypothetical protein
MGSKHASQYKPPNKEITIKIGAFFPGQNDYNQCTAAGSDFTVEDSISQLGGVGNAEEKAGDLHGR